MINYLPKHYRKLLPLALGITLLCNFLNPALGHEVQPSIATIKFKDNQVMLEIAFNAELFLAEVDSSNLQDTDELENDEKYTYFRKMNAAKLVPELFKSQERLLEAITLTAGINQLEVFIDTITVQEAINPELARTTILNLNADLPESTNYIKFSWDRKFGPLVIRQEAPKSKSDVGLYSAWLEPGSESGRIFLNYEQTENELTNFKIVKDYILIGIQHIVPKGQDHILFIVGLFFFSSQFRSLLIQISVFTLAHSITLILSSLALIKVSNSIVEPLIALSIAWIGFENIFRPRIAISRITTIFFFGLLHGLGFASVLDSIGLSDTSFIFSLIGFNIGVEFGQIFILILLTISFSVVGSPAWYISKLRIPISGCIIAIGFYWFFQRLNVLTLF